MITVDVLAPAPKEEDGGLGLDVIWYKEHQQARRQRKSIEKDKQYDRKNLLPYKFKDALSEQNQTEHIQFLHHVVSAAPSEGG